MVLLVLKSKCHVWKVSENWSQRKIFHFKNKVQPKIYFKQDSGKCGHLRVRQSQLKNVCYLDFSCVRISYKADGTLNNIWRAAIAALPSTWLTVQWGLGLPPLYQLQIPGGTDVYVQTTWFALHCWHFSGSDVSGSQVRCVAPFPLHTKNT